MTMQPVYAEKVRLDAIAKVSEFGLAEAARMTNIPKSTLHVWCVDAGVATSTEEQRIRTEAATQASVLARKAKVAQSQERMALVLATIAEMAARVELKMLEDAVAGKGDIRLGEAVGARTRALHDLALISGQATERTEIVESVDDVVRLQIELRQRLGA